jgi:hypothetical protein
MRDKDRFYGNEPATKLPIAMRRYSLWIMASIAILMGLSGCAQSSGATFLDPVAYCSAVKTIDHPDLRYIGPASPDWIESSLGKQLKLPLGAATDAVAPVAWRCAEGAIMACSIGMGMPCEMRPSKSRVPTKAAIAFCRAFPDVERPLPNLGSELSAYQWVCSHGYPRLIGFQPDLDDAGYFKRYWISIPPSDSLSAGLGGGVRFQTLRPAWINTSSRSSPRQTSLER